MSSASPSATSAAAAAHRRPRWTSPRVLPSLPMFLVIPLLLRAGVGFAPALIAGCVLTMVLYLAMVVVLARFGITL